MEWLWWARGIYPGETIATCVKIEAPRQGFAYGVPAPWNS